LFTNLLVQEEELTKVGREQKNLTKTYQNRDLNQTPEGGGRGQRGAGRLKRTSSYSRYLERGKMREDEASEKRIKEQHLLERGLAKTFEKRGAGGMKLRVGGLVYSPAETWGSQIFLRGGVKSLRMSRLLRSRLAGIRPVGIILWLYDENLRFDEKVA